MFLVTRRGASCSIHRWTVCRSPTRHPRTVHIVLLGFGRMGRSVAVRAAKIGHFANGRLLRITVVDRQAELQRERLLFVFPLWLQM